MRTYRCIKVIEAFKIDIIHPFGDLGKKPDGAVLTGDGETIKVSNEYMLKHKPRIGGYYVQYKDGYESYSPAEAFEEGYVEHTSELECLLQRVSRR